MRWTQLVLALLVAAMLVGPGAAQGENNRSVVLDGHLERRMSLYSFLLPGAWLAVQGDAAFDKPRFAVEAGQREATVAR